MCPVAYDRRRIRPLIEQSSNFILPKTIWDFANKNNRILHYPDIEYKFLSSDMEEVEDTTKLEALIVFPGKAKILVLVLEELAFQLKTFLCTISTYESQTTLSLVDSFPRKIFDTEQRFPTTYKIRPRIQSSRNARNNFFHIAQNDMTFEMIKGFLNCPRPNSCLQIDHDLRNFDLTSNKSKKGEQKCLIRLWNLTPSAHGPIFSHTRDSRSVLSTFSLNIIVTVTIIADTLNGSDSLGRVAQKDSSFLWTGNMYKISNSAINSLIKLFFFWQHNRFETNGIRCNLRFLII